MHRSPDNPLLGLGVCVTVRVQAGMECSAEKWVQEENMQGYTPPTQPRPCLHALNLTLPLFEDLNAQANENVLTIQNASHDD